MDRRRPDHRGQAQQLRHHLCRRLHEAADRFGAGLHRLRLLLRRPVRLRLLLLRQLRHADRPVAVHPGQGQVPQAEPRTPHRLAGRRAAAGGGGAVLPAPGARHRAALQGQRPGGLAGGDRLVRHPVADAAEADRPRLRSVRRGLAGPQRQADPHGRRTGVQGPQQPGRLLRLRARLQLQHRRGEVLRAGRGGQLALHEPGQERLRNRLHPPAEP